MRRKDGSLHWVSINARPVLRSGNMLPIEGTCGHHRRKEATEALAEAKTIQNSH
jgi:hypothetical protein